MPPSGGIFFSTAMREHRLFEVKRQAEAGTVS
jgi:hypothetical protein